MTDSERIAYEVAAPIADRLEALRDLIPEAFTEDGVDFDKLRAALGDELDDAPERYSFSWAGKRGAIQLLQTASRATLAPARDESVAFDDTQHVFIEGENLETLKLLRKAYAGQVKMIYIDPPYNTGNDFIYPDDFRDPLGRYLQLTGQSDEAGNLLTSNPETSGRYHSAWLSMMYPRLFLARQLLREDGVIFVSIDDHEVHNLRLLMNEIFGEENFIACLVWKRRQVADSRNVNNLSTDHEYVVCYQRTCASLSGVAIDESKYSNSDNDPRGPWMSDNLTGLATRDQRPNLHYDLVNPATGLSYPPHPTRGWLFEPSRMQKLIDDGRVLWPTKPDGRPRLKRFLREMQANVTGFSTVQQYDVGYTTNGSRELVSLLDDKSLAFPKPSAMLRALVAQGTSATTDDIVLDFFAGSGTLGQSVLDINASDGGNRRFVCVQLPEPIPESEYDTLAGLGRARLTAHLEARGQESGLLAVKPHSGFRVFKLAASNFRQWDPVEPDNPGALVDQMGLFIDPLVDGWQSEDVLWEVAIKEGYALHSRVEQLDDSAQNTIWRVTDPDKQQSFLICLDHELQEATVAALRLSADDLLICRDVALSDTLAANLALQCRLKTI